MNTKSQYRGTFISLFIATAAAMLGIGIIEPIMPLYAKNMGASGIMLGLIFSGFAVSRMLFAPWIGRVSDKQGRKKFLICGIFLLIIFSVLYVVAKTPLALICIRTAQGLASVMITPIAQAYVGDITPVGKEGRYMNLFFVSYIGGTAVGPVVGGVLSDKISLEAPFYAMAAMAFVALLLVFWLVPQSTAENKRSSGKQVSLFKGFKDVIRDRNMKGILIYLWSRGFYRWGFNSFFPILATRFAHLNKTQVGLALSAYMLAGAVLQYPSGVYADKYVKYRGGFILIGGLLSAICMFVIPSLKSVYGIIAFTLIMGLTSAFSRASTIAIRTERGRVHGMGTVAGASTTSISLGQVVGPILFGVIVSYFNIPIAFYFGGIIGFFGAIMAFWYIRKLKAES